MPGIWERTSELLSVLHAAIFWAFQKDFRANINLGEGKSVDQ